MNLRSAVELGSGVDTPSFLKLVDDWQSAAHQSLLEVYRDDVYSKLVALKAANLIVRRFELVRRRRVLLTRPSQVMVDPTNACQLACPGCVHGEKWSSTALWPKNTLKLDRFEQFLSQFGPTACATMLYNFGEPLLNKRFPEFVKLAKGYQSYVAASTNLSLPIDADAIVISGLDLLVMSIDGTTQETYERYRINGRLDRVLDNIKALVAARKRAKSRRPYLAWQFLTFEHNQHQLDDVFHLAGELGVDSIKVVTPSDWGWSDRDIQPVKTPREGEHRLRPDPQDIDVRAWRSSVLRDDVEQNVHAAFGTSWSERFNRSGIEEADRDGSPTCPWLYDNITMDGAARLMPCCLMPVPERPLLFGKFAPEEEGAGFDFVNTRMAVLSRSVFADSAEYARRAAEMPDAERPYCATCTEQPAVPFAWPFAQWRVTLLDPRNALGPADFRGLTGV